MLQNLIKIRNLFIASFILGAIFIIIGFYTSLDILTVILSIAVMVVYFLTGIALNKQRDISVEQLADSNYYLGFLFTLLSLSLALSDIVLSEETADTLTNLFGTAMSTTIVGLLFRIYLVNFISTEEANREIFDQKINDKINMMSNVLSENIQKNQTFTRVIDEKLDLFIDSTHRSSKKFTIMIEKNLKTTFNNLENSMDEIVESLEKYNDEHLKVLAKNYDKINKQQEEYEKMLEDQIITVDTYKTEIDNIHKKNLRMVSDENPSN